MMLSDFTITIYHKAFGSKCWVAEIDGMRDINCTGDTIEEVARKISRLIEELVSQNIPPKK